ncbi:MAG: serine/threonine-protein kinase [Polyangiaceae bacterium]
MGAVDPYLDVLIEDGGYKLVDKIGEGTMGSVYRAVQVDTGTEVAVKILHTKFALEREFVERFKREVRVLSKLTHPNTVRILGHGEMDDTSLYIVMELLQGRGLEQALRADGPWPLERAISLVMRVAYALDEAHLLGIVHRDLKPENIFLVERSDGGGETPKLLDFGLAKMSRGGESSNMQLTQEGDILGTPAFMSPEQSFGENLDGRADIYSLGVILYELLTGQLPYEDTPTGPQLGRYFNEPIPIDQRVEGIEFPPDLWPVIQRALEKLPEDRYSNAMEFAAALQPFNTVKLSIQPPAARLVEAMATASGPARGSTPPPPASVRHPPMSVRDPNRGAPMSVRGGARKETPTLGRIPSTPPPPPTAPITPLPPRPASVRPPLPSLVGRRAAAIEANRAAERNRMIFMVIVVLGVLALAAVLAYLKK